MPQTRGIYSCMWKRANGASTTRGSTEKGGRGRDAAPARHTPQPRRLLEGRDGEGTRRGIPAARRAPQPFILHRGPPKHLALKADRNVPRKTCESPHSSLGTSNWTSDNHPELSAATSPQVLCSSRLYSCAPDSTASAQAPVTSHLATASK